MDRKPPIWGDDTIDLPVMQACGLGIAVADAHPLVLAKADLVTRLGGGVGPCARCAT